MMTNREESYNIPYIRIVMVIVISLFIFLNSFGLLQQITSSHTNIAIAMRNISIPHDLDLCTDVRYKDGCVHASCSIMPSQPECALESQSINYSEIYRSRQNVTH